MTSEFSEALTHPSDLGADYSRISGPSNNLHRYKRSLREGSGPNPGFRLIFPCSGSMQEVFQYSKPPHSTESDVEDQWPLSRSRKTTETSARR